MGAGIGRCASWNVTRVSRDGAAGAAIATTASISGSEAAATRLPAAPIECPTSATFVTSGRPRSHDAPARASAAYSPTDIGSSSGPFAPLPRTSNVRTWKPMAWSTWALGSVRSRADSQPWISATPGAGAVPAGRNQPGRRSPSAVGTSTSSYGRPIASGVDAGGGGGGEPAPWRGTAPDPEAGGAGGAGAG